MAQVFLTSLPRSGSTWAGKAIADLTGALYINEPFNWKKYPEREKYHMMYMQRQHDDPAFRSIVREEAYGRSIPTRLSGMFGRRRLVMKDVHTCLAVEAIEDSLFHPRIVILVRHPCAVAASWKRLGYEPQSRVRLLTAQPEIVSRFIGQYEGHIHSSDDYFFQLGAYWGASYRIMFEMKAQHPKWVWIDHASLCDEPRAAFISLLEKMNVGVVNPTTNFFERHDRRPEASDSPYRIYRRTSQMLDSWKRALTIEEQHMVLKGADPFDVQELLKGPFSANTYSS